ncbi:MAG: 50S ribosomal protein L13 [Symbiobacteriaceae bacterium]|nr:50S ribosomal protein L13 [Symbiobacteriaceae bacterium]
MRTTYIAKPAEVEEKWWVIDAEGQVLGRVAAEVAAILRGKHKPTFTPHVNCGDHVIIVNADKVVITGRKLDQKFHQRYSYYPGGLKQTSYRILMQTHPTRALESAIKGMLPHTRLGRLMMKKCRIYASPTHPHQAQMPEPRQIRQKAK